MNDVGWIPAADVVKWRAALEGLEHGFAHLPEYSAAAARVTGHQAGLWHWTGAAGRAACPVGRRPAPGGGFDVVSPLGFGGFAVAGAADGMAQAWRDFWRDEGALCAYVQLSAQWPQEQWRVHLPDFANELSPSRECWLWDLRPAPDALAAGMAPKHRQLLHKWERESSGLCWDREELQLAFDRLYADFVVRRGIGAAYRYTPAAIAELAASPGALWVGARDDRGAIEAVTVFLWHGRQADSFLNAATPEGRRHSRGLYWHGALRLRRLGVENLNLGGGVTDGDELARFKQRLGASARDTLALRQVFDPERFGRACSAAGIAAAASARFPPWPQD